MTISRFPFKYTLCNMVTALTWGLFYSMSDVTLKGRIVGAIPKGPLAISIFCVVLIGYALLKDLALRKVRKNRVSANLIEQLGVEGNMILLVGLNTLFFVPFMIGDILDLLPKGLPIAADLSLMLAVLIFNILFFLSNRRWIIAEHLLDNRRKLKTKVPIFFLRAFFGILVPFLLGFAVSKGYFRDTTFLRFFLMSVVCFGFYAGLSNLFVLMENRKRKARFHSLARGLSKRSLKKNKGYPRGRK